MPCPGPTRLSPDRTQLLKAGKHRVITLLSYTPSPPEGPFKRLQKLFQMFPYLKFQNIKYLRGQLSLSPQRERPGIRPEV